MRESKRYEARESLTVEYSVAGDGAPILVMHGGHSNCQEEFGYSRLTKEGYMLITPSRPGYGATSAALGKDLATACRAYAGLLDHLQLEKVHIIAMSAGGPSGICFAAMYPERVKSLTLQSAVTKEWLTPKDKEYKAAKVLFRPETEKHTWRMISFMGSRFPKFLFRQMAPSFSSLPYKEVLASISDCDIEEFTRMNDRQRSGAGFMIDLAQTDRLDSEHLKSIRCPVLIFHSRFDRSVPIEHAFYAYKLIPGSVIQILDAWGHLVWLGKGSGQMENELVSFLRTV